MCLYYCKLAQVNFVIDLMMQILVFMNIGLKG